jgi:archaellum component FlaG (FlaF/FlaG flagellin family)
MSLLGVALIVVLLFIVALFVVAFCACVMAGISDAYLDEMRDDQ